jgi:hypothetical protein
MKSWYLHRPNFLNGYRITKTEDDGYTVLVRKFGNDSIESRWWELSTHATLELAKQAAEDHKNVYEWRENK